MISFTHCDSMVTLVAGSVGLCNPHNHASPMHWGPLPDSPEGRAELRRRIRVLFATQNAEGHCDDRLRLIREYAEANLMEDDHAQHP